LNDNQDETDFKKKLQELPENLKALFRPCAMVVPDFELICEIMLVAEGFQDARLLARKFITLYTLCKELLSKQDHYDWGLRAIKSVLVVAGSLKVKYWGPQKSFL
jgi:dynein heavy chain, axonemal